MAFNTLGVSLPFLKLMRNHPRFCEEMTTTDFCNEIAMPDTKERKCAYIELFAGKRDEKGRLYVAPATAFVSHAWQYFFLLPYDVMEHHDDPNAYFWFDVFINNQHTATSNTFEWWKTTFQQAIGKIGTVLLVMSPWNAPIPLSRVSWKILHKEWVKNRLIDLFLMCGLFSLFSFLLGVVLVGDFICHQRRAVESMFAKRGTGST